MGTLADALRRFLPTPEQRSADAPFEATWNGAVVARSDRALVGEGDHYFPPDDLRREYLEPSERHTVRPWKGRAGYFDVVVDGRRDAAAAWHYPDPSPKARRIKDHVAFGGGVEVRRADSS